MPLSPRTTYTYHVFLASPGDVNEERQHVRQFFERYNRHHARLWNVRFEVVDWENYSAIGVGRPQELITQQTLEKYKDSLALVVGIMGQRFGMPTGEAESGTEEEFNWALESNLDSGWPEIKWFFRKVEQFVAPADPKAITKALKQWKKVNAFRERLQKNDPPIYYREYPGPSGFRDVLENDLNLWLSDGDRPWVPDFAVPALTPPAETAESVSVTVPAEFDVGDYRQALVDRFDVLNFEMLDVSGAYYGGVKLWSVFVPQSVRECHEYAPHLLEMPKEHVERLIEKGEVDADELAEAEQMQDERRRQYLNQPVRPVLGVMDDASLNRCVILGDPGSGKSALLRYLAIRWTRICGEGSWAALPVPLLIELRDYHRWNGQDDKSILRYLQTGSNWHRLNPQTLNHLTENPERVILLLDGLDEIFDPAERALVVDDIQQFSRDFPDLRIVVTSRVVGYRPGRLRDAKFRHFMIQDLDESQIDAFLGFWHDVTFEKGDEARQKRERLLQAIQRSKSIAQLAGNPLLLTMMAILNRNQKLPDDRVDLYAQCSRLLLHQWDVERTLGKFPGLSDEIGLREKTDILRTVAYAMQTRLSDKSRANYIDGTTLASLIEDYLHTELRFEQSRAVARALVEQLRTRNFILCDLGADSYAFVHRTFLEYFCAADIVHQFNVAKTLSEQDLIALFDAHCRDDDWREVLRLICGQIDEQFVGRIVEHLTSRNTIDEVHHLKKAPEIPLAIWCLSEVRNSASLTRAGQRLFRVVIQVFQKNSIYDELDQILAAARELGSMWPGVKWDDDYENDFDQLFELREEGAPVSTGCWPVFVAHVFDDRLRVANLAVCGNWSARSSAFEILAQKWPDETTRKLLAERAVNDEAGICRGDALKALFSKWPDANTRTLLEERVVQDKLIEPRIVSINALAEAWPDENTRSLLEEHAVRDEDEFGRQTAMKVLAETWRDETTWKLIAERADRDEDESTRRAALQALAEKWPDETTRELLAQRAVQDDHEYPRSAAIQALAENWPDEATRELLVQRAVQDDHEYPRYAALQALVGKWPDETTRELLAQRAVQDEHWHPRIAALGALAKKWPDETTREMLAQLAIQGPDGKDRGEHCSLLGKMHSEFGRILPTRDLDGVEPYLDPLEPIPRDHIERAAEQVGIRPADIDAQVASLSAHFGWDITRGAKAT
jgi:hypothetical protein